MDGWPIHFYCLIIFPQKLHHCQQSCHWWIHHHDHHDWQSAAGFRCVAFMAAFRSRRGGTQSKASLLLGLLTIMSNVMMMMIFSAGFYIIPSSLKMAKNFESEAWYGSKDVKTRTIKDKPFFLNRIDCFWSNLLVYLSSFPCKFSDQGDVVVEKTLLDIRGHATDHKTSPDYNKWPLLVTGLRQCGGIMCTTDHWIK